MALTPENKFGSLNGTSAVDLVAVPAASEQFLIQSVTIYNADTITHTVTIRLTNSGTDYPIAKTTITPGQTWIYGADRNVTTVLDATTESLTAVCAAATATVAPTYTANYISQT